MSIRRTRKYGAKVCGIGTRNHGARYPGKINCGAQYPGHIENQLLAVRLV